MFQTSSSVYSEKLMKGHFFELDGKDGRKWKLYSILDKSDMAGLSFLPQDVKNLAYQDIAEGGYTLGYSGYIPLPFTSYPLVPESPEGIIKASECLWCYCVECGEMLSGRSVLAIQFIVGTRQVEVCSRTKVRGGKKHKNKKKKKGTTRQVIETHTQVKHTYLPRLLCVACHPPNPSYTTYSLIVQCFEVLDTKMFSLMTNYEKSHPFDKIIRDDQLLRAEEARRRYCLTCGFPDKNPYCSGTCKVWHDSMVLMKLNMGMSHEQIRRDDEAFRVEVKHKGFDELMNDYIKGMLLFFKQAKFNIYKRLRPTRCQNMLCPTNLPGRKKPEDIVDCCGKCNRATYCSKDCQRLDYEHHKTSCEYWNNAWDEQRLVKLHIHRL